jgi:VanZ family protein
MNGNLRITPVQTRKTTLIFRALFIAALVVTTALATTSRSIPGVEDINDKVNHVFAFFTLALLSDFSRPESRFDARKIIFLLGFGLAIEITQSFLPYRSCSMFDLGADAVGLFLYRTSIPFLMKIRPLKQRWEAGVGRG